MTSESQLAISRLDLQEGMKYVYDASKKLMIPFEQSIDELKQNLEKFKSSMIGSEEIRKIEEKIKDKSRDYDKIWAKLRSFEIHLEELEVTYNHINLTSNLLALSIDLTVKTAEKKLREVIAKSFDAMELKDKEISAKVEDIRQNLVDQLKEPLKAIVLDECDGDISKIISNHVSKIDSSIKSQVSAFSERLSKVENYIDSSHPPLHGETFSISSTHGKGEEEEVEEEQEEQEEELKEELKEEEREGKKKESNSSILIVNTEAGDKQPCSSAIISMSHKVASLEKENRDLHSTVSSLQESIKILFERDQKREEETSKCIQDIRTELMEELARKDKEREEEFQKRDETMQSTHEKMVEMLQLVTQAQHVDLSSPIKQLEMRVRDLESIIQNDKLDDEEDERLSKYISPKEVKQELDKTRDAMKKIIINIQSFMQKIIKEMERINGQVIHKLGEKETRDLLGTEFE
ncbi:hypothetical protein ADUPG1_012465 [Aduncisulcus paluster]|uniref:Uncharacterized protein n=1 Tax=Aduncisulcus paluster TaxID=2918883 RepID=A0ABQ5K1F0_9EUKA|nr:hypothetical protein ADUPG1_012465 [Aduncisulcus paluster]